MIQAPNFLMIGAAARNVGKTEFACELIRRYADTGNVVGVKITTVKERDGKCPRGGDGCGVCSSLMGPYCITEEQRGSDRKDTTRMLKAGANRVFWLRVMAESLDEGAAALMERIPDGAIVVSESNSARHAIAPSAFLIVQEKGSDTVKPSCRAVMDQADRIFSFDGNDWDFQPDQVAFTHGRWFVKHDATAVILAGGESRRMGRDKSMMPIDGKPMIQHIADQLIPVFNEVIIGTNDADKYRFLGLPCVPDIEENKGPLMGILSCVEASTNDINFITACDIPTIDLKFVGAMLDRAPDSSIVMPRTEKGSEPMFAIYRRDVAGPAREILFTGERRIAELFNHVDVQFVDMPEMDWYRNLNTMEEYEQAVKSSAGPNSSTGPAPVVNESGS